LKNISILGSTGSIGKQTLEVISRYPERFRVLGLSAGENIGLLLEQIREFRPEAVSVKDERDRESLRSRLGDTRSRFYPALKGQRDRGS
jgi:1-deoxy-D-xylulose-5-phosphate reductoisomerase